jgi:hypothetical protein
MFILLYLMPSQTRYCASSDLDVLIDQVFVQKKSLKNTLISPEPVFSQQNQPQID